VGKIVKGIAKIGGFGLLGKALTSGGSKKAPAPEPETPVMPLADDEAVKRAKRQAIAKRMSAGGRSSTILSQGDSTLGGGYG
jgi:hypothetical protein